MNLISHSNLEESISQVYDAQSNQNLSQRSYQYRKEQIQKISSWIVSNELKIKEAIKKDLKKPDVEIPGTLQ